MASVADDDDDNEDDLEVLVSTTASCSTWLKRVQQSFSTVEAISRMRVCENTSLTKSPNCQEDQIQLFGIA